MQEQLPRDVFKEPTGMYSRRVLGGTPYIRRIPKESCKTSANRSPRHGYLPSETRHKYIPVGSSKTSLFLEVSDGRYTYPGLVWVDSFRFLSTEIP
jgi:hypothetical protein